MSLVQHHVRLVQTDHIADLAPYHAQLANLALARHQWSNLQQDARQKRVRLVIIFQTANVNNAALAFIARVVRHPAQSVISVLAQRRCFNRRPCAARRLAQTVTVSNQMANANNADQDFTAWQVQLHVRLAQMEHIVVMLVHPHAQLAASVLGPQQWCHRRQNARRLLADLDINFQEANVGNVEQVFIVQMDLYVKSVQPVHIVVILAHHRAHLAEQEHIAQKAHLCAQHVKRVHTAVLVHQRAQHVV